VIGTVVDTLYIGSATNNLVITTSTYFGTQTGTVTLSGGNAEVVLYGIEGLNYSVQRATNLEFTEGVRNFPSATAPAGGAVSVTDDFSDLGSTPDTAFYRLQYLP